MRQTHAYHHKKLKALFFSFIGCFLHDLCAKVKMFLDVDVQSHLSQSRFLAVSVYTLPWFLYFKLYGSAVDVTYIRLVYFSNEIINSFWSNSILQMKSPENDLRWIDT